MRTEKKLGVTWSSDLDVTDILVMYNPALLDDYSDFIESLRKGTSALEAGDWHGSLVELVFCSKIAEKILSGMKGSRLDLKDPYLFTDVFDNLNEQLDKFMGLIHSRFLDVVMEYEREAKEETKTVEAHKRVDYKCTDSCEECDETERLGGGSD
jgi:hypothetical protein